MFNCLMNLTFKIASEICMINGLEFINFKNRVSIELNFYLNVNTIVNERWKLVFWPDTNFAGEERILIRIEPNP